ncbi:MAG TPA: pyrroline-5-carboxylate reductase [Rhodocyclaceae bacterium]|nr:pyrroline-5-carboxylate reductase [Rhodocyclaceae bacterium]HMZ84315.1 pyrroline-5-carboxylate reductase [Rhodocyclaceae bacterium]HNB77738.1 pyrroline-5-carboxylate reductase [Rhodocyclaceae bacterium]HNC60453.1 pyrroline-5-carboxylate reductase [Rhodocyclaceae bacterium]HNH97350.1 pyrroline-5-carboxylate reductase [Rhodocyclaceae bacterium]
MKISFIGGGNMAAALIGGMLKRGYSAAAIQVVELVPPARERLTEQFGVRCAAVADDAVLACDVLVLAVKPQQLRDALAPLAGRLSCQLVLSIAAGVRMVDIARWLGDYRCIVRAMPNTPALVGAGIAGLCADESVDHEQRRTADAVLAAVGQTVWIDDESQMDAVTAVSGSGPAYVFYFIEALQAAGEALGFSPDTARKLAIETFSGATKLAAESNESPTVLRERVTSKGGTTEAALKSLDADKVAAAISRAVAAACVRGKVLGDELGAGG